MIRFDSRPAGRWLLYLALLCAVLGAKLDFIERYGSDLPYWDQWDGEGEFLYAPYLEHRFTSFHLFRPHNEHRPVFTRLLALGLLELDERQWDGRLQVVTNTLLHAALALLLLNFAWRALPPLGVVGFAGAAAVLFTSSVAWENTLSGFQSQFYFVLLFAALHLGGTLLARPGSRAWWLAPLAGAAALLSMASGLLSALAILAIVVGRAVRDRRIERHDFFVLACNGAFVVAGLLIKANVPGHAVLKATGLMNWLAAFLHQFSWPVGALWAAPLGLLPSLAFTLAWFRRRVDGPVALTLLGAAAWFWLQAAAIAYARGSDGLGYSSRYCDTLALGLLIDLLLLGYLAATTTSAGVRRVWLATLLVFVGVMSWGLKREVDVTERVTLQITPGINAARIATVRSYVLAKDPAFFRKEPWNELPYPDAHYLARLLDIPALRAILPASVRPSVALAPDATTHDFEPERVAAADAPPAQADVIAWRSRPDREATFTSDFFATTHTRVTLFVRGEGGAARLQLIDEQGRRHDPLGELAVGPHWKRINFAAPAGRYRVEAAHAGPGWFAFTQPVTNAALANFAAKATRGGNTLLLVAGGLLLAALVLLLRREVPAESPA